MHRLANRFENHHAPPQRKAKSNAFTGGTIEMDRTVANGTSLIEKITIANYLSANVSNERV